MAKLEKLECEDGCKIMERTVNEKADEIYREINKRPTWTFYIIFTTIIIFILGGSYLYTTLSMESLERAVVRENERQDKIVEKIDAKLDRIIEKLEK